MLEILFVSSSSVFIYLIPTTLSCMQRFVHVVAAVIPRGHCGSSHALCPTTAVRANRHAQELVVTQPSRSWSNEVMSAVLTASRPPTSRRAVSTLDKHPSLAACFMGAATSKFLDASTISTNSRRLAWWRCPSCSHEHRTEVRTFAASSGQCPSCGTKPSRSRSPSPQPTSKRCISTSSTTLHAAREGQIKNHITEVAAFGTTEWRKLLQPMLAKSYDKVGKQIKWGSEKVMVSPKIDGVRCLVVCDAPKGSSLEEVAARTYFVTRSGILLDSCDHMRPQLAPLLQSCPGLVLDGEVYTSSLLSRNGGVEDAPIQSFDELVGVVRRGKEFASESILTKQQALEFHIFDTTGIYAAVHNTPFTERYAFLAANVPAGLPSVRLVPALPVDSHAHALDITSKFVADGYEGSMIRRGGLCRYAHGARSPNLLKVKTFEDAEFAVVGALEGKGKWQGMLGAFICQTPAGSTFTVSPQTDEKHRRAMWLKPDAYVGSALTVQYQGLSPSGIPRFPVGKTIRGGSMSDRSDWI